MSLLLDRFREIWAVDFEFIEPDGERPTPVCMVAWELRSGRKLYFWQDELPSSAPYSTGPDSLFVSFSAAAELGCHLVLNWPQPAAILDLYIEYRWLTNGIVPPGNVNILSVQDAYGIEGISITEKAAGRDKILRGGPRSVEERQEILVYCETDVIAVAKLLPKMILSLDLPRALLRGRFTWAIACMRHVGVPVDMELLSRMRDRWPAIKEGLIAKVDPVYGVFENGSFRTKKFIAYLIRNGIPWPMLKSGEPELTDKVFEQQAENYPQLRELRYLREILDKLQLSSFTIGRDGFNRAWLRPFWTVTGRNQPSPAEFIFAAASWLRGLVKPPPGYGLCYLDWVQQEFGIAAALSGDPAMITAYQSGDSYLWFAKETGRVPQDATKKTHELEREHFKQCTLGTQYEIGDHSLATRIQQSNKVARQLLQLHRETFHQYWRWLDDAKNYCFLHTKEITVYGWQRRITDTSCNHRSVGNFYSQANGAEMYRLSAIFGVEAGVQIIAPMHDAHLIIAPLDRLDADIALMRQCMERASELVLDGFKLRVDEHPVCYPDRYTCKKGEVMWNKVMSLL